MKRLFSTLLVLLALSPVAHAATHTAHLIGDSTVCIWASSYYPKMGWGQVFQQFFNSSGVAIDDKAISGQSSKSYYLSSAWTNVRNSIHTGDYVFIQFGHNDEKTGTSGYTSPYTTYEQYLTDFINETRARGGYPVLVTPVERNSWSGGKIVPTHGNYPDAMRQLAAAKNVPLIDLTARSTAKYEALGQSYTTYQVFMNLSANQYTNYPNGSKDNTHFQQNGATIIARLVVDGIRASTASQMKTLASYLY